MVYALVGCLLPLLTCYHAFNKESEAIMRCAGDKHTVTMEFTAEKGWRKRL